jgi:hypothetical protein
MMESLLVSALHLIAETALAANPPLPDCGNFNLYGCGGASNVIASNVIPNLAIFFLRVVAAASVVFIIYAGMNMLTTFGDTGKSSKARWAIVNALGGLALALGSQMLVGFVATEEYGQSNPVDFVIGGLLKNSVRIMLTMVNVIIGFVVIVLAFRMVAAQGKSDEYNAAKTGMVHLILGAIVINASLALVRAIATFFGS